MATQKVKCSDCDNMILPETAARYDGLCRPCSDMGESARREQRERRLRLAAGLLFVPSEEELASARQFEELEHPSNMWRPAFGEEEEEDAWAEPESMHPLLEESLTREKGLVFMISDSGRRLNLTFNREFGVCEYGDEDAGQIFYAHTEQNMKEQVPRDLQLAQSCSSSGEGLLWYPSRFHMRRTHAFAVIARILHTAEQSVPAHMSRAHPPVRWLRFDDISDVAPGNG